jgi:prephenate dehydrogenase
LGCHPLAGSEKRGIANATLGLFKDSLCILTPGRILDKTVLNKISSFWHKLGARTIVLRPETHDKILAFASHLPHVLAFSLMHTIADRHLQFIAGGFKDTTRVASSDPKIWEDIFITNRKELVRSLDEFQKSVSGFKKILKKGSKKTLFKFLNDAKRKRDSL